MGPASDRNEQDLSTALSALREGDLNGAEAIARRLFENMPDDPAVHQLAAVIALQRGEIKQAVRSAAASLARRPDHVPTLVIAGRAARASQNLAGAAALFRRAGILAPNRADAAFLTCVTLLELGDPEAGTLLPRLLDQFPDDPEGWRLLGAALERAEQREAALVAFTRAAHAAPSVALHLRRGVLLESLGRTVDAIAPYRAAIEIAPDQPDVWLKLGLCLRRTGADDAAAALERAVTLAPDSSDAWFAVALVRQDERDFRSAAEGYDRALEIRPQFAEAAVNLGICHQEDGDMAAAKAAYQLALRLQPDTFGRIAQALAAAPIGEVWLDIAALRGSLTGRSSRPPRAVAPPIDTRFG
jgi:tetratricopeptide (TPR) repeat protein